MIMRDRERLIARIRQIRRVAPTADTSGHGTTGDLKDGGLPALQARVAHLERMVEGLQDSVHRESERQSRLVAELQAQVHPGAMGAALAKEARNRGL